MATACYYFPPPPPLVFVWLKSKVAPSSQILSGERIYEKFLQSLEQAADSLSSIFLCVDGAILIPTPRSHIGTVESNIGEIIPDTRRSSLCGRQPFDLLTIVIPALNLSPMPVIWFDLKSELSKKNQKQCYPCR